MEPTTEGHYKQRSPNVFVTREWIGGRQFSTDGSEGSRRVVQVVCTRWGAVGTSS